jgi:DNA-binding NtrC family response regulator
VLVVEDEALLSLEIAQILSQAGFNVIGPARIVARALELVERAACCAAVLDVRLKSGTSEHVAQELKDRGMPFVAISGYSQSQLPPVFQGAPFIAKPFAPETLIAELRRCIGQP